MVAVSSATRFSFARFWVATLALVLLLPISSGAHAQQINPLDVEPDPNGVDMLHGNVQVRMPTLSIPAAPELAFQNLSDFFPMLQGKVPSGGLTEDTSYQINAGSLASDGFACADVCAHKNDNGSVLSGPFTQGPFDYTQGRTGMRITFDVQHGYQTPPIGGSTFRFLGTTVELPGGPTLTFAYQAGNDNGYYWHRPTTVTSTSGYQLVFTYHNNTTPSDPLWRRLQSATIVETANPGTPLASLTYSSNGAVITDIAGRQFDCVGCLNSVSGPGPGYSSSLELPGEANPTFEVACTSTSCGYHADWDLAVTTDGVTYNYDITHNTLAHDALDRMVVTGPEGFYRRVEVEVDSTATMASAGEPRRRVTSITNSENQTTSYSYANGIWNRVESISYPGGRSATVTYDVSANVTSLTQTGSSGSITQFAHYNTYNECSAMNCFRPEWTEDGNGNRTEYTWDNSHGQLLTQLDPVDANGQRRKVKNTYDTSDRLIREEICAADVSGNELTCGTANSFVREITYFAATRLPLTQTITDGVGTAPLTTSYTYDVRGNLLSEDGPLPGLDDAAYYLYDALNRRTWEIGPRNEAGTRAATRTTYRVADGQPELVESGFVPGTLVNGTGDIANFTSVREVETEYNSRRLAIQVETRENGVATPEMVAQTSYDGLNRAECSAVRMNPAAYGSLPGDACALGTSGTSGEDRVTRTVYDTEGRTVEIEQAVGTTLERTYATYEYNVSGEMTAMTDARGYRAEMVYDGFGRQTHWYFPSPTQTGVINSADYEQYTYDANGNRTSLRRRDGSTLSFTYDNLNRMTVKTVPNRAGLDAMFERDVYYQYDIRGLQTRARFDSINGEGLTTTYDRYGRITDNTMTMDGVTRSLGYTYNNAGSRKSITFPDAVSFNYTYNSGGFFNTLTSPSTGWLVNFNYNQRGEVSGIYRPGSAPNQVLTYDEFGRLASTGWTQGGAQAATWSFTRNPASQIASEALSNPLYSWDAHPAGVTTANYTTNGLNQYTDVGNNDLCHDANGNLTADGNSNDGGWVYLYDVENRLVQMRARTDFANCPTLTTGYSGALAAQLEYDPMGRLYEVRGYNAGALQSTTRMLYDGDALVAEYNTAGTMLARYVHGPAAGVDDPLISYAGSSTSAANVRYLYSDARGSIVLTTNEAHSVPSVNTYDPYGLPGTNNTGRFQYTGQIWLDELGLYYYKARMYSPTLGRFMQTDPIGYEDNVNLYAYVGNDPVNGLDPYGMAEVRTTYYEFGWRAPRVASVTVDADVDGNGQDDLTQDQLQQMGDHFSSFIARNDGSNISDQGKTVDGPGTLNERAQVSVISQFVGAALSSQSAMWGSGAATGFGEAGRIFVGPNPETGDPAWCCGNSDDRAFGIDPSSRWFEAGPSDIARMMLHESVHMSWGSASDTAFGLTHRYTDYLARNQLRHLGLDGGGCLSNGAFPGC